MCLSLCLINATHANAYNYVPHAAQMWVNIRESEGWRIFC